MSWCEHIVKNLVFLLILPPFDKRTNYGTGRTGKVGFYIILFSLYCILYIYSTHVWYNMKLYNLFSRTEDNINVLFDINNKLKAFLVKQEVCCIFFRDCLLHTYSPIIVFMNIEHSAICRPQTTTLPYNRVISPPQSNTTVYCMYIYLPQFTHSYPSPRNLYTNI